MTSQLCAVKVSYTHFLTSCTSEERFEDGRRVVVVKGSGGGLEEKLLKPSTGGSGAAGSDGGDSGAAGSGVSHHYTNIFLLRDSDDSSPILLASDNSESGSGCWLELSKSNVGLCVSLVLDRDLIREKIGLVVFSVTVTSDSGQLCGQVMATPSQLLPGEGGAVRVCVPEFIHAPATSRGRKKLLRSSTMTTSASNSSISSRNSGRCHSGDVVGGCSAAASGEVKFTFQITVMSLVCPEPLTPSIDDSSPHYFELVDSEGTSRRVLAPVLASLSPVFGAMLRADMREAGERRVHLEGVEGPVMALLASYLHVTTQGVWHLAASGTFKVYAYELLVLADMYDIKELRDVCALELCGSVNRNNICELLVAASNMNIPTLSKCAYARLKTLVADVADLHSLPNYDKLRDHYDINVACEYLCDLRGFSKSNNIWY